MKVFLTDIESHEAYRRGKAVDRQDRIGGADNGTIGLHVVEPSEEIRHLACRVLCTLLHRALRPFYIYIFTKLSCSYRYSPLVHFIDIS